MMRATARKVKAFSSGSLSNQTASARCRFYGNFSGIKGKAHPRRERLGAMELGERITYFRGRRSQERVAQDAGIAVSTLSRIERGHHKNPSQATLMKIAKALQVNARDLLDRDIIAAPESGLAKLDNAAALADALFSMRDQLLDVFAIAKDARSRALEAQETARAARDLAARATSVPDDQGTPHPSPRRSRRRAARPS
jgi:transcriptional regulator with XRE-family HTH domain